MIHHSISKLVRAVFDDQEIHHIQDIYTEIESTFKKDGEEIDRTQLHHRIRSRLNDMNKNSVIERVGFGKYRLRAD